ncbi:DUF3881 family protein [Drancourtella massiliensis]|uniref:Uncharacterized protein n=2 Tax=Clostridia TaxID=186801 RepID=A0A9W6C7P2_9FIRM|nr:MULTISPECIES: DUF3881 family protein [Clostridia]RHV36688.1 DUF3881 family protein [Ruminococcus sp. OM05-10BH]MBM6745097.1 DUF3881 family protein [Drancourtella massiliensis]OUN67835.1 hypothetical protein B5G11_14795 [Drancourtella sp. An57]OUQ47429.1 hypothetical protein B5E64_00215 [Drancourtella sp. An12]GLG04708.1 hypothetical protein Selli1_18820 [Sellimonas catena]
MHKYSKAIGFGGDISGSMMRKVEEEVRREFTSHERMILDEDTDYCEFRKILGERLELAMYGVMDLDENFEKEYSVPVFQGKGITTYADVIVEKKIDKEAYIGICEDARVDISLMFYLQNPMEYVRELQSGNLSKKKTSVTLAGLAYDGTVLFPVTKNEKDKKEQREQFRDRMMLVSAARKGDSEAIETLTLKDMDTYQKVSKRVVTEDIFSIIDTYFMPYGVECDLYSIMGEILDMDLVINEVTREKIMILTLDVNEMIFDVCIPKANILGEPAVGRRFRTNIWLQGKINFS